MKGILFTVGVLVLFFGCITPQDEPGSAVESFYIESENGTFRHVDYYSDSNPFSDGAGGDLGETTTAYIKVDQKDLRFLSDCNEQAFWFNLKTKNGKGVIFEAVYSVDFKENCSTIKFFGKEYELEIIDEPESSGEKITRGGTIKLKGANSSIILQDGENIGGKWDVILGWKDGEVVKIIIYTEGYFHEMESGEIVPLFSSGNAVLGGFTDMDENPTFKLVTTEVD